MRTFATVLAVIVITGVLLEGSSWMVLRLFSEQQDSLSSETHVFDAHRNHRLNPDFQFSSDPRSRIHSEDGFRQAEPVSIVKPADTIRVVVLGTSALYGAGAYPPYPVHRPLFNDETITHFLELNLNKMMQQQGHSQSVEVINAGVSAGRTFLHLVRLNDSILDYSPDVVVNLDGHNDFYVDKLGDRWNSYSYSTNVLVDEFNGRTPFLSLFTTIRCFASYSNFFNLLEKGMKRVWHSTKAMGNPMPHTPRYDFRVLNGGASDIAEAARRSYIRDLWQIRKAGEYSGYDHCVILQPEVVFEEDHLLADSDQRVKRLTIDLQGSRHIQLMEDVRSRLPELFQEAGLEYHDLGAIASERTKDQSLYIDYCHLSPQGSSVLAGYMAEILYPMVLKRVSGEEKARQ